MKQRDTYARSGRAMLCLFLCALSVMGCGPREPSVDDKPGGYKDREVMVMVPFGDALLEELLGDNAILLVRGTDVTPIAQASGPRSVSTWEEVTVERVVSEGPEKETRCEPGVVPPRGIGETPGRLAVDVFGGSILQGSERLIVPGSARFLTCKPGQRCLLIGYFCGDAFHVRHGEGMLEVSADGALAAMGWKDSRSMRALVQLGDVETLAKKAKELRAARSAK